MFCYILGNSELLSFCCYKIAKCEVSVKNYIQALTLNMPCDYCTGVHGSV